MTNQRKSNSANLELTCSRPPKGASFKKGRWVYRQTIDGKRTETPLRDNNKLLREDCSCSLLHATVEAMQGAPSNTLKILFNKYFKSQRYAGLSHNTKLGYQTHAKSILEAPLKSGKLLGDVTYESITPGSVRKYLDKRLEDGAPVAGNREMKLISTVYGWAYERDIVTGNPCKGVRRNPEKSRTRLITDQEYNTLLEETKGTMLNPAIRIAYLCRARREEVFSLTFDKISDQKGVYVDRSKGSLPEWTSWSDELKAAIDSALKIRKKITDTLGKNRRPIPMHKFLFINKTGQRFSVTGLNSQWQRLKRRLIEKGAVSKDNTFTFHDLKAYGVTNHRTHESGHKSEKAKAVYMRGVKEVEATK